MAGSALRILDQYGRPFAKPVTVGKKLALNAPMMTPYDAGDVWGAHMREWQPYLWSPDTELNPNRDRIVARVRDMVRNDGWAYGGITRVLDNAIGPNFRPISKPDHRYLKATTGIAGFDATWAHEFGRQVEAHYRSWADDPGRWCDIERGQSLSGICYTAFRHKLVDGDALAMMRWEPSRMSPGRASYCTAVQGIDPDRLSNPMLVFDMAHCRGGVQIDDFGAAVGYHIREAHQGDWYNAAKSLTWKYINRETDWGRPIIVHDFDRERFGQHRGGAGVLTAVLQRFKMLVKYDTAEVDAAILNTIFGAYLESPYDHEMLQDALGDQDSLSKYQDMRAEFHKERRISIGDVVMPTLFPNEKINTVDPNRPSSNFRDFEAAVLRNIASGMGISPMQLSQDWSDVNYSSARASLLEAWKTMDRRRAQFVAGFSHQIFLTWLEESFASDKYDLPAGAPKFILARGAYGRARWIGPGKGWVDPVAEKEGAWLGMEIGLSTLEDEAADQGADWEDNLDQLQVEAQAYDSRGLTRPSWMGQKDAGRVPGAGPKQDETGPNKPEETTAMPVPPKVKKQEATA